MLGVALARGLVPADVGHRVHAQVGVPVIGPLHLAHKAERALGQRHQLAQQRLERRPGARAGNEHALGPRDGLQQPVLARQHGLGGAAGTGAGGALQHGFDLRGQGEQVVQRRVLHGEVVKAVAHGLRRVGLRPHAHDDDGRNAVEQLQQVKGRAVHGALGRQHDVGPVAQQMLARLGDGLHHVHAPARPGVGQRPRHGLCVGVITLDQQDGDGHGPIVVGVGAPPATGGAQFVTPVKHIMASGAGTRGDGQAVYTLALSEPRATGQPLARTGIGPRPGRLTVITPTPAMQPLSVNQYLRQHIRTVPDWPAPGVQFRDITPLLQDPKVFRVLIDAFVHRYMDKALRPDVVAGLDARGFILGAVVAYELNVGFVPIRKKGKLPFTTVEETYELEYGSATVELHTDAVKAGDRVLLIDDLIATGGTMMAGKKLLEKLGATVTEGAAIVDLPELGGSQRLRDAGLPLYTLVDFAGH